MAYIKEQFKKVASALSRDGLLESLFSRFLSAYFIISTYQIISARSRGLNPISQWKDFIASYPLVSKLLWVVIIFWALSNLYRDISKKFAAIDHVFLILSASAFSLCLVWRSNNFYLGVASAIMVTALVAYAMERIRQDSFEWLPDLPAGIIVFAVAALVIVFIAVTTIAKHRIFGTAWFDMGIFVQTFHSLKEHFTAVITCERNTYMSHFNIHASYIYYLFLPVYALFPKAETLLAGQAFLAIAGVVPLFLMARKHGFKGFALISMCLVYVFYAGLVLPCYYDFHENAFLPTILMWLLYAADQKNIPLLYIMSVLTCTVKEDAPLFVISIGLFFVFDTNGSKKKHGFVIAALSAVYFVLITNWLGNHGDGQYMMSSRLGNLVMEPTDGAVSAVRNALINPGYAISQLLQEKTLLFFVQTMLPLLFLPLITSKLFRFLLLVPYMVINLIVGAQYGYAANIGYQYIFGPSCLLIYMTMRNVEDVPQKHRNMLLLTAALITTITTVSMASQRLSAVEQYQDRKEYFQGVEEAIRSVPQDASVIASAFLLSHAADRDQIYGFDSYDIRKDDSGNATGFIDLENYDFCILNKNDSATQQAMPFLDEAGWTVYAEPGDSVIILVSPEYLAAS